MSSLSPPMRHNRLARLALLMAGTAGLQATVQALGMLTGLVIVRETTSAQYAYYSLTVAVVAIVSVTSESGLANTMLSLSRLNPTNPAFLAALIAETNRWRSLLFGVSSVLGLAALVWLLDHNGASWSDNLLFAVAALINMAFATSTAARLGLIRVQHRFTLYSYSTLAMTGIRAAVTCSLFIAFSLGGYVAVLISGASYGLQYAILRSKTRIVTSDGAPPDQFSIRRTYKRTISRLLPMKLAIVFQGQLVILAVGAFGSTQVVAALGAVSRYAVAFAVVSMVSVLVLGPVVAHGAAEKARLRVSLASASVALILIAAVGVIYLARDPLLEILGVQYSAYSSELVLVSVGGALQALVNVCAGITEGLGWLAGSWLYLPSTLATAALSVWILDMDDPVQGALLVAILPIPGLLIMGYRLAAGGMPRADR